MGPHDYFKVTNPDAFGVQDSHVRFLAGVWLGIGAIFVASAFSLQRVKSWLYVACGLIVFGGLIRLGTTNFALVTSPSLIGSLGAEIIGVPILMFWVKRSL